MPDTSPERLGRHRGCDRQPLRPSFEQWKHNVDQFIINKIGLTADDLPDAPYRRWYESHVSASAAANRAIKLAKEF